MPRYPDVKVQLSGEDGNAFAIIGRISQELRRAGYREAAKEWQGEAVQADSYDALLRKDMSWVEVH